MSLLSSLIDAIDTRLAVILPSHHVLTDPYQINRNSELSLKQGYGLAINSGTNTNRQIGCALTIQRDITVTISRNFITREFDQATKETTYKNLIEDQLLVIKEFEKDPSISYTLGNKMTNFVFRNDSGIIPVFDGKFDYLMIQSVFSIEYYEEY